MPFLKGYLCSNGYESLQLGADATYKSFSPNVGNWTTSNRPVDEISKSALKASFKCHPDNMSVKVGTTLERAQLLTLLDAKRIEFYTYSPKSSKLFKVFLKNLLFNYPLTKIVDHLETNEIIVHDLKYLYNRNKEQTSIVVVTVLKSYFDKLYAISDINQIKITCVQ